MSSKQLHNDNSDVSSIIGRGKKHSDYSSLSGAYSLNESNCSSMDDDDTDYSVDSNDSGVTSIDKNENFINDKDGFCKKCQKEIPHSDRKKHVKFHQMFYCNKCNKHYTKIGITRHSCTSNNFCHRCKKKFPCKSKLEAHFRKHFIDDNRKSLPKNQTKNFTCTICNKTHRQKCYDSHMKAHTNIIKCDKCGKSMHKRFMERHMKCCCKFKCSKCDLNFDDDWKLQRHLKSHGTEYRCKVCEKQFRYLVHMANHYSAEHCNVLPPFYQCVICDKVVKALPAHLRTHADKPVTCDICSKELKNYSAYKEHARHHKRLAAKGLDREIIPKTDQAICSEHKCSVCSKSYRTKTLLLKHFKSHLKLFEFICPYCDRVDFSNLASLNSHVSKDHWGYEDGNVKCVYCAKVVQDIQTHYRMNHRLEKYECELCGIRFCRLRDVSKHYGNVHDIRIFPKHKLLNNNMSDEDETSQSESESVIFSD